MLSLPIALGCKDGLRRRRLLNAGLVGAAGARRLAVAVPGAVAGSERVAAPAACRASTEAVAVAASNPGRDAAACGASWETIPVPNAGAVAPACAAASSKAVTDRGAGAKASTATCAAADADAVTAQLVGASPEDVASACHTGCPRSSAGTETVSVAGFAAATCPAAASSVELRALDDLHAGPALAQLLRAILPGSGAGGEGCRQVGLHPGPLHPRQAPQAGLP